ncbi:uncharacterized protein LOC105681806 isoform X1 [Bombus impatiens]|uniref:Uncharacterized protein LOC105681806 isoform X1 n=1 Tax=Bombus impatiens TaxID=132113 RepID=A0A6P6FHK7_BOMIM|nr:uncharacterized protein LOC105681806 isoform X1 [Bombus impatiens]
MRSKQQPRPSFRWPQQRGDNLTVGAQLFSPRFGSASMEWASTLSANRDPRTFGWMVKNHNDGRTESKAQGLARTSRARKATAWRMTAQLVLAREVARRQPKRKRMGTRPTRKTTRTHRRPLHRLPQPRD